MTPNASVLNTSPEPNSNTRPIRKPTFPFARCPLIPAVIAAVALASSSRAEPLRDATEEVSEFVRGDRMTLNTKGHPKSPGIEVEFQCPASWKRSEGIRPHVVISLASPKELGPNGVLQISSLAESLAEAGSVSVADARAALRLLSAEEESELADELFSQDSMRLLFTNSHDAVADLHVKRVHVDKWPGAIASAFVTKERVGMVTQMYMFSIHVLYKENYLILFLCVPRDIDETRDAFQTRCRVYLPLFLQIANSIVIQSQYVQDPNRPQAFGR